MGGDTDDYFRGIFKSGSVVFAGYVIEMGISLFAKVIAAQFLERSEYGAVALGLTLLATITSLIVLGLPQGVVRFLPRFEAPERRRGVLVSALQVLMPTSIVVSVGLLILAHPLAVRVFDDPTVEPVVRVFAVAIPFATFTQFALGAVQGSKRSAPKVVVENLGTPAVRFTLVIAAVFLGLRTVGIAWAYSLARILPALLALYYVHRHTTLFSGSDYIPMRRELLAFSVPLIISGILGQILSDLDTYLIGYYMTVGSVGDYNIVYTIATTTGFVLSAFGYLTMPSISELHAEGDHTGMANLFRGVTKWIFLVSMPLIAVPLLYPRGLVSITFGEKYVAGAPALQILAGLYLITTVTGPSKQVLTSIGETRAIMWITGAAAAANAVLNVALIPRYGLVGAAAATLISFVLVEILVLVRLHRQASLQPFSRPMLVPAGVGAAILLLVHLLVVGTLGRSLPTVLLIFSLFGPLYLAVIVRFGAVEEQELMIIESVEHRFSVDLDPVRRVAERLT